jgi:putative transposase
MTKENEAHETISKLTNAERQPASGRQISNCVRGIGVTEVAYYRGRNKYTAIEGDWPEYLTELEKEVSRLRRLVSDLTLDKTILMKVTTAMLSPELRADHVFQVEAMLGISERRACQALGQHKSTQLNVRARSCR